MAEAPEPPSAAEAGSSGAYAWYALAVLVLVYALNFIDRQLLTILAADIKRDLRIGDGEFGFLYGTAFALFYALFAIPLGKLADRTDRTRLLAAGLALWSLLTALSGLSRNLAQLSLARIGVGIGEATAGPCGYSLLSDYFPPRRRATAIAVFSAGIYLGGGVSLFIGTAIAQGWNAAFGPTPPFGLAGWQAAFLAVGLPGLALALWVASLREPDRGRFDRAPGASSPLPRGHLLSDFGAIVPPFTVLAAARRGGAAVVANLAVAAGFALTALLLTVWLGDGPQWVALGIGFYAVASWVMALRHDDPQAFATIWADPAVIGVNLGYGLTCAVAYASSAFGPLFAMEVHHASPGEVALIVGGSAALGGALGVIAGGALGDRLAVRGGDASRVLVIIGAILASIAPNAVLLLSTTRPVFYAAVFPFWFLISMALGGASGTIVSIVPATVRGTATAAFFLGATMIGLAIGPYAAGRISTATGSLRIGLGAILIVLPGALLALLVAWRSLSRRQTR